MKNPLFTRRRVTTLVVAVALAASFVKARQMLGGTRPRDLGLVGGTLRPCPDDSRNCVCSRGTVERLRVAPFRLAVPPDEAIRRIADLIRQQPRTQVVTQRDDYLHAEFTTKLFRFVDDLELHLDAEARMVHVRSQSRVGKGDLGVNRRRVEQLRQQLGRVGIVVQD